MRNYSEDVKHIGEMVLERIVNGRKEMNESNLLAAADSLAVEYTANETVQRACEAIKEMTINVYRLGMYERTFLVDESCLFCDSIH